MQLSSFKDVSDSQENIDKFNNEWQSNFLYRTFAFSATVFPRNSDNSIDWKGKTNFNDYWAIIEPELAGTKFKSSFATLENYQEIGKRIESTINPKLTSLCSQFSSLSNVKDLNNLVNNYLGEILKANIYAGFVHYDLGDQLNISNHVKYQLQPTGDNSVSTSWNCFLYGYSLKKQSV